MSILNRRIADLFAHDITRTIEEVIKVDQTNEAVVSAELREYVTTEKIRAAFAKLLDKFKETPQQPHEGIGIWISGFFGSGKSSFAKILGYVLENRHVLGDHATDLFLNRLPGAGSEELKVLLREITAKIPTTSVIFDLSTDRGVKTGSERITAIMYRALLRDLGYSQDFTLAELEINLESEGRLSEFESRYETVFGKPWRTGRGLIAIAVGQASRIMHDMDPSTYPAADSWVKGLQKVEIDTDPNRFADRVFDLVERRREGKTIVFVIDEVGQYVARSTDKMLDLQGVVQALGAKGRGKAWVAVTSQERLQEIVSSLDQTRIELARLQDRFPLRVDLEASDISEVTSTRVLAKKADVAAELGQLYEGVKGQLSTYTKLNGSARYPSLGSAEFAKLYPFLPYQIDLIIDVISGLRLQAGGSTHTGGSSRTIIKLAQQVIVDDRIGLSERQVGPLVTLDQIYDLIDQFVTPDRRADIEKITRDFPPSHEPLVGRVAKAICLLEQVKNVKRSAETLAAVLHPDVKSGSIITGVQDALEKLKGGQWIEEGEHGWQLLSPQGKQWAVARQSLAEPKEYQYTRYKKELLEDLLRSVKDYRHKGHRTFKSAIQFGGEVLGNGGDIGVEILLVDQPQWETVRKDTVERSREHSQVFWIAPVAASLYRELEEYHRSREMINNNKREAKERGLLAQLEAENRRLERHRTNAINRLTEALMAGETYFEGIRREADALSEQLSDVLQKLFAQIVPLLYPKFDLAAFPVKDNDITRIIDDKTLGSLPDIYYSGANRSNLVVKEGGNFKPNPEAELAAEVMQFITRNHRPPERVFGKVLLEHFRGIGYGWDPEPVRMITATLLRAGKLEIIAGGQRIQSHADVGAREVFATLPAFRSASYAPKTTGVTWEEVVEAATACTDLFGDDVPFDNAAVVAEALKKAKEQEQVSVYKVQTALMQANLPGKEKLDQYLSIFGGVVKNSTDDMIKAFLAELETIRDGHELTSRLQKELVPLTISTVNDARSITKVPWGALSCRPEGEELAPVVERLKQNLTSVRWFEALPDIKTDRATISKAYLKVYKQVYEARSEAYRHAIEDIKGHAKWPDLSEVEQKNVLFALSGRVGDLAEFTESRLPIDPTINEMESHIEGLPTLKSKALFEIEKLTTKEVGKKIERVKISGFVQGAVEDQAALDEALERLRTHCAKLISSGAKVILE